MKANLLFSCLVAPEGIFKIQNKTSTNNHFFHVQLSFLCIFFFKIDTAAVALPACRGQCSSGMILSCHTLTLLSSLLLLLFLLLLSALQEVPLPPAAVRRRRRLAVRTSGRIHPSVPAGVHRFTNQTFPPHSLCPLAQSSVVRQLRAHDRKRLQTPTSCPNLIGLSHSSHTLHGKLVRPQGFLGNLLRNCTSSDMALELQSMLGSDWLPTCTGVAPPL